MHLFRETSHGQTERNVKTSCSPCWHMPTHDRNDFKAVTSRYLQESNKWIHFFLSEIWWVILTWLNDCQNWTVWRYSSGQIKGETRKLVWLLDFVVVRFLTKLFRTVNNKIINDCCSYFRFSLPSELLEKGSVKCQINFMQCTGMLQYFGIKT